MQNDGTRNDSGQHFLRLNPICGYLTKRPVLPFLHNEQNPASNTIHLPFSHGQQKFTQRLRHFHSPQETAPPLAKYEPHISLRVRREEMTNALRRASSSCGSGFRPPMTMSSRSPNLEIRRRSQNISPAPLILQRSYILESLESLEQQLQKNLSA